MRSILLFLTSLVVLSFVYRLQWSAGSSGLGPSQLGSFIYGCVLVAACMHLLVILVRIAVCLRRAASFRKQLFAISLPIMFLLLCWITPSPLDWWFKGYHKFWLARPDLCQQLLAWSEHLSTADEPWMTLGGDAVDHIRTPEDARYVLVDREGGVQIFFGGGFHHYGIQVVEQGARNPRDSTQNFRWVSERVYVFTDVE